MMQDIGMRVHNACQANSSPWSFVERFIEKMDCLLLSAFNSGKGNDTLNGGKFTDYLYGGDVSGGMMGLKCVANDAFWKRSA